MQHSDLAPPGLPGWATRRDGSGVKGSSGCIVGHIQSFPAHGEGRMGRDKMELFTLIRWDHKQVDDQPAHFTVERLHQIKCVAVAL